MRPITFAVPGDLDTPTGGYRYDRALIAGLREWGHGLDVLTLEGGFPRPSNAHAEAAMAALQRVSADRVLIMDGLAYGVLPADGLSRLAAPFIALCHHPLALETGISEEDRAHFFRSEQEALAAARHVLVTSPHTKAVLSDLFGLPADRVTVAPPGLSPTWHSIKNAPVDPPRIVAVGSLTPRKGYDVLLAALRKLGDLAFHCDIVGSPEHDPATAGAIRRQVKESGLTDRVILHGGLPEEGIAALFGAATVFALATRYEGFGMVFAEALAAGLPVVGTRAGAVPDVVPGDAGALVEPDDPAAFANALRKILMDKAERRRLATGARNSGPRFGGWDRTAALASGVVEAVG
ncbi:MAG: glycosyltransferase family 4 protein [Pseudomonadota bacterium]